MSAASQNDQRAAVLGAVAAALRGARDAPLPPEMRAFDVEEPQPTAELAAHFKDELERLGGEVRIVGSAGELATAVADYIEHRGLARVAVAERPSVRAAMALVSPDLWFVAAGSDARTIDAADAGVLAASALLADTGSAIVVVHDYAERLLQYMPRTCLIVADGSQLHAHLDPASMAPLASAAQSRTGGEATIITGPSRTADIEKTLVLGAHGPQSLIIFLMM